MQSFDLNSYLQRISYAGDTSPSANVLHAVTEAHTKAIPFENIDVVLNKPIQLSGEALFDKLVARKRGGYCFEQNGLFLIALRAMGFKANPISARVRLRFTSREQMAPRTHVFIQVEVGKDAYLTDVGMGAGSLTQALKLTPDLLQETPHDTRRLVREGHLWYHQIRYGDVWQDACEFTLEAMPSIDQEIANWYTSAHPQSHFRDRITASRALDGGERLNLLNFELSIRTPDGHAKKTQLSGSEEMIDVLINRFGLLLSEADKQNLKLSSVVRSLAL